METVEDVLAHFGIKGMRWGTRRSRGGDSGGHVSSASDAERAAQYHKTAKEHGTHALSNHELQHLVSRMNLEQQYSKLTSEPSTHDRVKRGHDAVRNILGFAKTAAEVHGLATGPMVKDIKKAVKK